MAENAIAGDAMRPGDVLSSRAGLSIEVGNTDAEGRLILADALTRAGELQPALTIDLATLTGAARVALGPEVIPFYTADEALAADVDEGGARRRAIPFGACPCGAATTAALDSDIADLKNDPDAWAQAGLGHRRPVPAAVRAQERRRGCTSTSSRGVRAQPAQAGPWGRRRRRSAPSTPS